jgi:integrase
VINRLRQVAFSLIIGAETEKFFPPKRPANSLAVGPRWIPDKKESRGAYRQVLEKHVLPELGGRKPADVTVKDIARLHAALRRTPYAANRMLAVAASMFTFARKRETVPTWFVNPARGIEKYREHRRERFLSVKELGSLGEALREAETIGLPWEIDGAKPTAKHAPKPENRRTKIGPHACAAVKLLLLTGARLREILHLRWSEVDFERGLLLLPDSKSGRKTIYLNPQALETIEGLPRVGAYVIAGQSAGTTDEKPRADLKAPWAAISKRAGLSGVRIHDLRHTFTSVGAGGHLGLPIIGKLLGHTQSATTARYAHLDSAPMHRASQMIGAQIAEAMGEPAADDEKVVPFRSRR